MTIKELYSAIKYHITSGCPIDCDPTPLIAIRKTAKGDETAGVKRFYYDKELDSWAVEILDWRRTND